ncbi:MAG: peptidoglycan DD-metalloendopeptidase family protein [Prevotella sp.]|nr:peptidoglycan DD-metalloendopeptidase family protein [Prevotella sp.]
MRIVALLLTIILACGQVGAQTAKKTSARKPVAQKTVAKKKGTTVKKRTATKKTTKKNAAVSNSSINGLRNQSAKIKKEIRQQEQRLKTNQRNVSKRLQNLMIINQEINVKRKTIDTIRHDINKLDDNILTLKMQLELLQEQLDDCKQKYVKSVRYMRRNNSTQDKLLFIFSAKNFMQMYRRSRFVKEYAAYQRIQGEELKRRQAEMKAVHNKLVGVKQEKNTLLYKGVREQKDLEGKQTEQQQVVNTLKNEQKTIQSIIAQQRKKDAAINSQIDRLVAIEVEKARQRAIAEAKRKAEEQAAAQAAAKKKREEEIARKKAEAEAAARIERQRIAEAKAREERLKEEARIAADAKKKAAAEKAAKEAENERRAAERRAAEESKKREREIAAAKREAAEQPVVLMASEDRKVSGNFESNRGRLPMPVVGSYKIVSHFGQYNVEGLQNVRLDNKGINILGQPGAKVRSIFDGEVTAVFSLAGTTGVMVRHGNYISVYCNLGSVSVRKGQHVSTRQVLGTVGAENILQFQLRRETAKLNPEAWLGR